MHHQPESRLAQSQAHFYESPRCPPKTTITIYGGGHNWASTRLGCYGTFSLVQFQGNKEDGAWKRGDDRQVGRQAPESLELGLAVTDRLGDSSQQLGLWDSHVSLFIGPLRVFHLSCESL